MKKVTLITTNSFIILLRFFILLPVLYSGNSTAQNWLTTGNSGITSSNFLGSTNAADLIFKANNKERGRIINSAGSWRFGSSTNFAKVDSTGKLSFGGSGDYRVAGNKYVFRYSSDPDYGLFFNSTNTRYEFRSSSAVPTFYVGANTGSGVFLGTLKVGAYTLPSVDGLNGQVLKTNGTGVLTWSNDNNSGSGGANTSLSNLSATAVSQALLPSTDNAIDLGSSSKRWKNIYLGNRLYLGTNLTLHSPNAGSFFIGMAAGNTSLTGYGNTGTGQSALVQLTGGENNTANGYAALYFTATGDGNTAIGYRAMYFNTGSYNTATGSQTLHSNMTGVYNTADGYHSLFENRTGYNNTANGVNALYSNIDGNGNTASGVNSLYSNTTGYSNTAIGIAALFSNTTISNLVAVGDSALYNNGKNSTEFYYGGGNTAVGSKSLFSNTNGSSNTAMGFHALYSNITGLNNTGIGRDALYSNTDGAQNTGIGNAALNHNTQGNDNTATGEFALGHNTTGSQNTANGVFALSGNRTGSSNTATGYDALTNTTGSFNTGNGERALTNNTSGVYNSADGYHTLYNNTIGYNNTANGVNALYSNIDGNGNTANGVNALYSNTTGGGNVGIGLQADVSTGNLSYATVIGAGAIVDASYKVRIGNTSVTKIGGQVGWTTFSDGRYKRNIKETVPGLSFINSLRPITYTVDINGLNKYYNKAIKQPSENKNEINAERSIAADRASEIVYNGFIAQEVEEAAKKLNFEFSGVDKPQSKDGVYGLRYDNFVVPLVKAVQELSRQNEDLQKQIDELKKLIVSNLQTGSSSAVILSDASLEQNVPNPYTHSTTINYTLPQKYSSARIAIIDRTGKILKEANLSGSGKGSLKIDAHVLASGAYSYSLYVEGKLIGTKQMVLAR